MLGMEREDAAGRGVERAVGERNGVAGGSAALAGVADPELVARAKRRRFTAEYKLRVLREGGACNRPGGGGALLRWGGRGAPRPREAENGGRRTRAERAEAELEKARRVIEVQGNVSALLGQLLEPRGATAGVRTGRCSSTP